MHNLSQEQLHALVPLCLNVKSLCAYLTSNEESFGLTPQQFSLAVQFSLMLEKLIPTEIYRQRNPARKIVVNTAMESKPKLIEQAPVVHEDLF